MRRRKKLPEVERIANILRGIAMHLRIINTRSPDDLSAPLGTIENIIKHIDDGEDLL